MATAATTADGATQENVATAIGILRQRFGDRLQTGAEIRRQHANTITWIPNQPPDAVIWVENAEEVRNVVDVARTHRVPSFPSAPAPRWKDISTHRAAGSRSTSRA